MAVLAGQVQRCVTCLGETQGNIKAMFRNWTGIFKPWQYLTRTSPWWATHSQPKLWAERIWKMKNALHPGNDLSGTQQNQKMDSVTLHCSSLSAKSKESRNFWLIRIKEQCNALKEITFPMPWYSSRQPCFLSLQNAFLLQLSLSMPTFSTCYKCLKLKRLRREANMRVFLLRKTKTWACLVYCFSNPGKVLTALGFCWPENVWGFLSIGSQKCNQTT